MQNLRSSRNDSDAVPTFSSTFPGVTPDLQRNKQSSARFYDLILATWALNGEGTPG